MIARLLLLSSLQLFQTALGCTGLMASLNATPIFPIVDGLPYRVTFEETGNGIRVTAVATAEAAPVRIFVERVVRGTLEEVTRAVPDLIRSRFEAERIYRPAFGSDPLYDP